MSDKSMGDIGEKAFLKGILPHLAVHGSFINGFGHDASVVDLGFNEYNIVIKIDRAAKPIAAINGWCDYKLWGRLAVTANCSDILATGGDPKAFVLSISIPAAAPATMVSEIIMGAEEACQENGIAFVGGDTKEAREPSVVGSAIGVIPRGRHFDRRKGRIGDRIVLAGKLGGYVGAYWHRVEGMTDTTADYYLAHPAARWREAAAVAAAGGVHSACDLSDGLIDAVQSLVGDGLGARLDGSALPYHPLALRAARELESEPVNFALGVGDWGIAYAMDKASCRQLLTQIGPDFDLYDIGEIVNSSGITIVDGDREWNADLEAANEHFRSRMEDQGDWFSSLLSGRFLTD